MTNLADVQTVLDAAVAELPDAEVADAIGMLAAAQAKLLARLTAPSPSPTITTSMLTAEQIADVLNVPASQIGELGRQRRIPSVLIGKYRRYDLQAVRQALDEGASSKSPSLQPPKKRSNGTASEAPATALLPRNGRQDAGKAGVERVD